MGKIVGNCNNQINWNKVISAIIHKPGKIITADENNWNLKDPKFKNIYNLWVNNNINTASMQWINYYPGVDFNESVVAEFSEVVNAKVARAWISRVNPGFYVGLHWDADDNEDEYLKLGDLVRFTCNINEPLTGQVSIVGDDHLHSHPRGTIYQWDSYKDWHTSFNCSIKPKFQFNFLGYR